MSRKRYVEIKRPVCMTWLTRASGRNCPALWQVN